jgi:hypothetical protein
MKQASPPLSFSPDHQPVSDELVTYDPNPDIPLELRNLTQPIPNLAEGQFLNVTDCARIANCKPQTIVKQIKAHHILAFRLGLRRTKGRHDRRHWVIDPASFERWVRTRRTGMISRSQRLILDHETIQTMLDLYCWTVKSFARKMGVHPSTWFTQKQKIEKGGTITLGVARRIAQALDLPLPMIVRAGEVRWKRGQGPWKKQVDPKAKA